MILKFSQKGILEFHFTIATDVCIKEVIDSSLQRTLWRKIMEALKTLILTITVLNLVKDRLFLKYCHYCHIYRSLYDISNL